MSVWFGTRPRSREVEGLCILLARVEVIYGGRVAEQEARVAHAGQPVRQQFIPVDAEVSGNDAERFRICEASAQVVDHLAPTIVQHVVALSHAPLPRGLSAARARL